MTTNREPLVAPWAPRAAILLSLVLALSGSALAGDQEDATSPSTKDALSIRWANRALLAYRWRGVPFKPYASELFTPSGVNILRDAPHDHLHHHALMFALAVDGVDFWAEAPKDKVGSQVHIGFLPEGYGPPEDAMPTGVCEKLQWRSPNGKTLLIEGRTIEVRRDAESNASLVTWSSRLRTPPGRASVELSGSHYFGLGMRFAASMDKNGRLLYADASRDEAVRGTEHVVRTRWAAYTAAVDGHDVTVALFDHPENPRHPAGIFTMTAPFAYLSATLGLHRQPMRLEADHPLELRWGVAVWDGRVDAEQIESLYRRWIVPKPTSPALPFPHLPSPLPHSPTSKESNP